MSAEPNLNVIVTHVYTDSAERVFDAWLDPEMIGRWMFGPALRDEEVVRITIDARVGGAFSFVVRRDGEEIDHAGEYLEMNRPRRLAFTWGLPKYSPDSARVFIDIKPLETGSELTLTHELHPNWVDYASQTENGWTKMLGALDSALNKAAD